MKTFVFGENKVGYGFAHSEDGQFIALCELDFPNQDRDIIASDVLLKFPNRASYVDWLDNLRLLADDFKE